MTRVLLVHPDPEPEPEPDLPNFRSLTGLAAHVKRWMFKFVPLVFIWYYKVLV